MRVLEISYLFGATIGVSASQAVLFRSALQEHKDIYEIMSIPTGGSILKEALHNAFLVSLVAAGVGFFCQSLVGR